MTKNAIHKATDNLSIAIEHIIDMTDHLRIDTHLTACRALLAVTQIRNTITSPDAETYKARQLAASAEERITGMIYDAANSKVTPLDEVDRSDLVDLIDMISVASECAWCLYASAMSSGKPVVLEHAHIMASELAEQAYYLIEHIRDARAAEIAELEKTLLAARKVQSVIDAMIPAPGSKERMREMMTSGITNPFSEFSPRVAWGDDEPFNHDDGCGRAIITNGRVHFLDNGNPEAIGY